jgi:DNA-binding NtrC family response regulator
MNPFFVITECSTSVNIAIADYLYIQRPVKENGYKFEVSAMFRYSSTEEESHILVMKDTETEAREYMERLTLQANHPHLRPQKTSKIIKTDFQWQKQIKDALIRNGGKVNKTAEELGLSRPVLYERMKRYGVSQGTGRKPKKGASE